MPNNPLVKSVADIDNAWGEHAPAHCLDDDPDLGSSATKCADFPPISKLLSIDADELKQLIIKHGQPGCGGNLYLRGAYIRGRLSLEGLSACKGANLPRIYLIQCLFDDGISFRGARLAHISLRGSRFSLDRNKKEPKFGNPLRHIDGDHAVIDGAADLSHIEPIVSQIYPQKVPRKTVFPDWLPADLKHLGSQTLLISMQGALIRGSLIVEHATFIEMKEARKHFGDEQNSNWYALDLSCAKISGAMNLTPRLVVHGGIRASGLVCEGEAWLVGSHVSFAYLSAPEDHRPHRDGINLQSALFQKSLIISQDSSQAVRSIITGPVFLYACTVNQQVLIEGVSLRYGPLHLSAATLGALIITTPEARDPRSKFSGTSKTQINHHLRWSIFADKRLPAKIGHCCIRVEPGTARQISLEYSALGRVQLVSTERSGPLTDSIGDINLSYTTCTEVTIGGIVEEQLNLSGADIAGDCIVACSAPRALLNQAIIGRNLDLKEWSTREVIPVNSGPQSAGDLPRLDIQNARIGAKIDVAEYGRIQAQDAKQAKLTCYEGFKVAFSKARIDDGEHETQPAKEAFLAFLESPDGKVLRLDGSSLVFHNLNVQQPPKLESPTQVIEYLVLFCAFTWADGGPFRVFSWGSICEKDRCHFDVPADTKLPPDLLPIKSTSLIWMVPGNPETPALFEKFQWSNGAITEPLKIVATPKAYHGLSELEEGIEIKKDFKEIPVFEWPTKQSLAAATINGGKIEFALKEENLNLRLNTLLVEYKKSIAPPEKDEASEHNPINEQEEPETDCWFVVASVWYQEHIFACLFLIENKVQDSQVTISMLGDFLLVGLSKPESSETSPENTDKANTPKNDVCLPWVPLSDYEAFERRKGGQAALIRLKRHSGDSTTRLDVEHYLGSPYFAYLESYKDENRQKEGNPIWYHLYKRRVKRQENRQKKEGCEQALWKGWGWSRKAYVDLSGSKCRVLADVSGRGWGDSVYFKTDRFEFETVVRKEFSKTDDQGKHSPAKKHRLILKEFAWKQLWKWRRNPERIDYTNEPSMSYYEQRLLWLSRYRMNDQSALERPENIARTLTDSAEDDINRWFEPGTFRSFARIYRERSLDQGAKYLDESLMRVKGQHSRWHRRHMDLKLDKETYSKTLLTASVMILAFYLFGMYVLVWGISVLTLSFLLLRLPLTKFAMSISAFSLYVLDTLFRWCFRYGLSMGRPILTILLFFFIGWWSVSYLDNRGFMVVETMAVSNQLASDQQTHIFTTGRGPSEPITGVLCASNIDHGLYALDKFIPLIEFDQDHRCLIRPFDANRDLPYSTLRNVRWYFGEAPNCASGTWTCHLLYPFKVVIDHPSTWRALESLYAFFGWIIISITLLTFSGVLRKHAEGR